MDTFGKYLKDFFLVPFRGRTYLNLIYLLLAFPLGTTYFVLLVTGFSLGFALVIVWVGLLILLLMLGLWWVLVLFERWQANVFLKAEVPPVAKPTAPGLSLWKQFTSILGNPVTWKGLLFLIVKFPLGIIDFVAVVVYLSVTAAFILAPFYYSWGTIDLGFTLVDTLWKALILCGIGVAGGFVGLHLLNGLAFLQKWLARVLLGDPRAVVAPVSAVALPVEPVAAIPVEQVVEPVTIVPEPVEVMPAPESIEVTSPEPPQGEGGGAG